MPELGVCKLMQPAGRCHAEVAPHILTAAEVEFLHSPTARSEPLVRVLGCDTTGNHVTMGGGSRRGTTGEGSVNKLNNKDVNKQPLVNN